MSLSFPYHILATKPYLLKERYIKSSTLISLVSGGKFFIVSCRLVYEKAANWDLKKLQKNKDIR